MEIPKLDIKDINKHNIEAYSSLSVDELKDIAIRGGIQDGCDIKLIAPYILQANSILEVGAGYGRVINHITKLEYDGSITAIEYSSKFCEILAERFSNRITLLNKDIFQFNPTDKYDCILWLWNGISDFPKSEQPQIIKLLFELLNPGGSLIFDTFPLLATPLNGVKISDQEYCIEINGKSIIVYCPTLADINSYADTLEITKRQHLEYITDTGRNRIMHIFTKPIF